MLLTEVELKTRTRTKPHIKCYNARANPFSGSPKKDRPDAFRVAGAFPNNQQLTTNNYSLPGADRIMREAIFIGVYPGHTESQLQYMVDTIRDFVAAKS